MGKRVIWIVLDSAGVGALPDADKFNDEGSDTIGQILKAYPDIKLPNMDSLGLRSIDGTSFKDESITDIIGCYGKATELSNGKDTTTGHWEMIGIITKDPFPTYPNGFPKEIIDEFIEKTGCGQIYGNVVASGIPIIEEYGEAHMQTGYPIIYTSADSVFQIAASEEKIGLQKLYEMCEIARGILKDENSVGRVIARPFVRDGDGFSRTTNRRDYALKPTEDNTLSRLQKAGISVAGIGKIGDIYNGVGIDKSVHTYGNVDGMKKTKDFINEGKSELIFTNLVDFDMLYGHRRNVLGYKDALVEFDEWLGELIKEIGDEDVIVITADHGCDPAYKGTDHTREYVPVLIYGRNIARGVNLKTLDSFARIGEFVEDYLLDNNKGIIKEAIL